MSLFKLSYFLCLGLLVSSCSTVSYSNLSSQKFDSLSKSSEQIILTHEDELQNLSYIGTVKSGTQALVANCGYDRVLAEAQKAAKLHGANILQIQEVKRPRKMNSCYEIKADMYRNTEQGDLSRLKAKLKTEGNEGEDFAVVHFFRDRMFAGSAVSYKLRMEDEVIGKMKNGGSIDYKVDQPGTYKFWAKTESKDFVELEIEMGKEYYVQCSFRPGWLIAKPNLYQVDERIVNAYFDMTVEE